MAARVEISYDPEKLLKCDRIVLPGVGGVRACMKELHRLELNDLVVEVAKRKPLLGICLGMQVMLERSQENGGVDALGLFPGEVVRFPDPAPETAPDLAASGDAAVRTGGVAPAPVQPAARASRLKVPHMGWNRVRQAQKHPIWAGVPDDSWFYFVHSYHAAPLNPAHALGTTTYIHDFASALARDKSLPSSFIRKRVRLRA